MSAIAGYLGMLLAAGGAGPSTLNGLIMANGPVNYWRNGEVSGSVMVDEVATNGAYSGAPSFGNAALYPGAGALTSTGGNFSGGVFGQSTAFPASLTSMTLLTIIRPTSLSGFGLLGVQRDDNAAGRMYQWRSNGAAMEFVKIVGGVATVSQASMLVVNTTYMLAFEVDAAGNYTMYRNGVAVKTGNIGGTNYGGAGDAWRIGYAAGPASVLTGRTCENAVFNKVLGPTIHAALFAASGL